MTKFGLLGAAAVVLSSAFASPLMAQEVIYNPGYCAQFYPNANCQNKGPGNPYTGDYQRRTPYRNNGGGWHDSWNDNRWERRDSGFWPGNVAAGVVGGAVGTAAAIATAPIRGGGHGPPQRVVRTPPNPLPRWGWPAAHLPVRQAHRVAKKAAKRPPFHAWLRRESRFLGSGPLWTS